MGRELLELVGLYHHELIELQQARDGGRLAWLGLVVRVIRVKVRVKVRVSVRVSIRVSVRVSVRVRVRVRASDGGRLACAHPTSQHDDARPACGA